MQKQIKDTQRELKLFVELAQSLKASFGEITEEKRLELEKRAWFNKAANLMKLDLLSVQGLTKGTLDLIFSLPEDLTKKLMGKEAGKRISYKQE
jgi:hypothetical protein